MIFKNDPNFFSLCTCNFHLRHWKNWLLVYLPVLPVPVYVIFSPIFPANPSCSSPEPPFQAILPWGAFNFPGPRHLTSGHTLAPACTVFTGFRLENTTRPLNFPLLDHTAHGLGLNFLGRDEKGRWREVRKTKERKEEGEEIGRRCNTFNREAK